jgi:hypothetical protein
MFRGIPNTIRFALAVCVLLALIPHQSSAAASREYQIKAAYLYNFLKFTDWPQPKLARADTPIIIGIVGTDKFAGAFVPLVNKRIKGRRVIIRQIAAPADGAAKIGDMTGCHLIFISNTGDNSVQQLVQTLQPYPVVTVSDTADFLDSGGMIQLKTEHKKVRFDVNLRAATLAHIKISSKLLSLAKRVVAK